MCEQVVRRKSLRGERVADIEANTRASWQWRALTCACIHSREASRPSLGDPFL